MAKLNPRLMIQIPLLLLGSCTPVVPSTSITIYTSVGESPYNTTGSANAQTVQVVDKSTHLPKPDAIHDCVIAIEKAEDNVSEIGLPDLSKIEGKNKDELNKAVVDLLIAHIKLQRTELRRLHTERKCLIGEIKARRS